MDRNMTDEEIMKWAEIVTFGKRMDGTMSVEEAEGYRKSLLNEMAYERKEFKALLANGSIQIIQNWCLIRYAVLSHSKQELLPHWKTELIGHLEKVASHKLKGNDSKEARMKAIAEVWCLDAEYGTDANVIDLTIHSKFLEEGINIDAAIYNQTIDDCMKASGTIMAAIASESSEHIENYVASL